MRLSELLQQIDDNQAQIDAHGKLDPGILKKINYKFRLDWNYYSNRMEGGTLTREETRSVMIGNIDVKGKPLKDVMEMNGHDRTVLDILKMGKGEQRISEKRIREIHKAIMYEEDPEKAKQVGAWKQHQNEILNYKGEKITFASPLDAPAKMHDLIDRTNAALDQKPALHPLVIAAQFHIDYVTIHPFYDGNGRTARILTNILLISNGYPPIIIKDQDKSAYYQLLADIQAYGGQPDLFYAFIGERLIESQELMLSAIQGEDIEEKNDLDKEIDLLKRQFNNLGPEVVERSETAISIIYKSSIRPLFESFITKAAKLQDLFTKMEVINQLENYGYPTDGLEYFDEWIEFISTRKQSETILYHEDGTTEVFDPSEEQDSEIRAAVRKASTNLSVISLKISLEGFNRSGANTFDLAHNIEVRFDNYYYVVKDRSNSSKVSFKKLYSETLTEEEISKCVDVIIRHFIQTIKNNTEK